MHDGPDSTVLFQDDGSREKDAKAGINSLQKDPTGFKGQKGFELKNTEYQKTRNQPAIIEGREYSAHALDQMQNRGLFPSVVEDTVNSGTKIPSRDGTIAYYNINNNLTVITNAQTAKVVTLRMGE